jgi:His/Glu/Gln/Arg/opine family amino acid ABC transporter permease subunit
MQLHFEQIIPSIPFLLAGTLVTLKYMTLSLLLGSMLGICLTLIKISQNRILRTLANAYTSIFRGTPLLVQLTLVYFAVPQLTGYNFTPFEAGLIAFSLNSAAYVSEVIRGGIQAVDKGQLEAAQSLGVPYVLTMRDIILPQAIKNSLPGLVNEAIDLLKESALVSVFGELDLLRRANIVSAEKFIYFEPLIFVAVVYYVLVMILSQLARLLEQRFKRSD